MDNPGIEENETRSRSFRYEDYNNRRVFLRSYPIHQWEGDHDDEGGKEKVVRVSTASSMKRRVKEILVCVVHWGGDKFIILKQLKHKVGFYLVTCIGFKSANSLISV